MPKFANIVTIEVASGRRDQVVTLLEAHKARCLKDEPDTLQFEILLPKDDDAKVLSYEWVGAAHSPSKTGVNAMVVAARRDGRPYFAGGLK